MAFNFKSNKAKIFNPITLPFAKCYHSYAIIIGSHTDTHTHLKASLTTIILEFMQILIIQIYLHYFKLLKMGNMYTRALYHHCYINCLINKFKWGIYIYFHIANRDNLLVSPFIVSCFVSCLVCVCVCDMGKWRLYKTLHEQSAL